MSRLGDAVSPYLRSHANQPVDWFPWGEEAFDAARKRDVPVLISIGYQTCHWCHVMARESFANPEIAALINDNLVAIKVDREEHPDVDALYMAQAAAFTENLGWPLTIFATPEGIFAKKVGPAEVDGWIGVGGRKDRGDSLDIELLCYFDTSAPSEEKNVMTRVCDSDPRWFQ
jgi:hypothetical protein